VHISVGSGSDDPDNPGHSGHYFARSSGSHLQNQLSGCDQEDHVSLKYGFWSSIRFA